MFEMKGKFADAKVFATDCDEVSVSQLQALLDHQAFEGSQIRIMPDVHAGAGCVIGFTCRMGKPVVVPNLIGVDIGCGVLAHKLPGQIVSLETFDKWVHDVVPAGFHIHDKPLPLTAESFEHDLLTVCEMIGYDYNKARCSLGSLGGGNHFIELGTVTAPDVAIPECWLTIHSGSRNFGLSVCNFFQRIAIAKCGKMGGLEYLDGRDRDDYLFCMQVAQAFADLNRTMILRSILPSTTPSPGSIVTSVHNYMSVGECEFGVIRKGAISAFSGQTLVIPWNMRDGLIIGTGKGNADWNNSAPHGAGRRLSRSKAKTELSMEKFEQEMQGIYSTSIHRSTLDESPMAYKDPTDIREQLKDTVVENFTVKPIYSFKAGN